MVGVQLLLDAGADLEARDTFGKTPDDREIESRVGGVAMVLGHPRTVSVQTRERKRVRIVLSRREVLSVALW